MTGWLSACFGDPPALRGPRSALRTRHPAPGTRHPAPGTRHPAPGGGLRSALRRHRRPMCAVTPREGRQALYEAGIVGHVPLVAHDPLHPAPASPAAHRQPGHAEAGAGAGGEDGGEGEPRWRVRVAGQVRQAWRKKVSIRVRLNKREG